MLTPKSLDQDLYDELSSLCRGPVVLNDDPEYGLSVDRIPVPNAHSILTFCSEHGLSPSVKAGGYGTAGWAIGGDVIIDLSKIVEVDIERPHPDGGFTSLRDVASANSKGKAVVEPRISSGKRRREEDAELRNYDAASRNVASLLSGPLLDELEAMNATATLSIDEPPPNVRRRLDLDDSMPALAGRQISQESSGTSSSGGQEGTSDSNIDSGASTVGTSPEPESEPAGMRVDTITGRMKSRFVSVPDEDPFGYLDEPSDAPPPVPVTLSAVQASYNPHARMHAYGSGSRTSFTGNNVAQQNLPVEVEPVYPHAFVTFGAGMRQKEIDTYTANHKLEARYITGHGDGIPYHIPFAAHPTGSSIMLLGGFGFLSRLHGLSIDNLVEVEMVLADGRVVVVSESEHPDLWWALRGAGTTLGIVTRYKAKAYPVPVVFAGNLIFRFNKATAASLIKHFRDCVKGAPRELYANLLLTAGPQGKDSLVVIQLCYVGSREKGQEFLTAISSWTGERCLLNEVHEKSFLHQQDSVAQVLRGKAGRQWFIRSVLISSLPDDIIHTTVEQFNNTPLGCTWLFELAGGAVGEFTDSVVPKAQREALFNIVALHQWEMDANDDRCIDSAEEWIAGTLKPVHIGGAFPSFFGRHEIPERIKASFGVNWDRLVEVKKKYDPKNIFSNSFWPLNEHGEMVDPRTHEPPTPGYLDSWQRAKIYG
ncbi:FAD linked oxidase domain-containing protein [Coprinopsis cinerea okayama7|uniref:FAD linked oxidase domain-containing protein n=1 Tax=Coprinopsis cinerea (strain Okayama-7 / 130 / ATCC MYA-4618 / FGSC 9003) TaxID=240176 RepID=A8N6V3_COPC7|nr:FAD linked oxidase domain-containing protein [Coprinopsis cinerea okayama7\|eukprot:XP_001830559.2 FAD linked oxidase domain-containing protein [Coprinopsis cinerea okayama7\